MMPRIRKCRAVLACSVLALAVVAATAEDQNADKPALSGAWAKKDAQLLIEFASKDVMKILPHGDSAQVILIECSYTIAKGGLVKAKVSGHQAPEEVKKLVPLGLEFSFQWKLNGESAKLDELKGDKVDTLKSHLEGDFEKK